MFYRVTNIFSDGILKSLLIHYETGEVLHCPEIGE